MLTHVMLQALDKIKGPLKVVVYWGTSNPDAHQVRSTKPYV